jgi:hypothetical protein
MSCARELEQIARDLIRGPSPWFKGNRFYRSALQAIIRDEGRCVYCKKDLWKEYGVPSCVDHLLPESVYDEPELAENVNNLVFACVECNGLKRNYDPSGGKGRQLDITSDIVRHDLIETAKKIIDEKRNADYWRMEFETAKVLFDAAVEKYRKCRETDC